MDTSDLIFNSLYKIINRYDNITTEDLKPHIRDSPYAVIQRFTRNKNMKIKMHDYWKIYTKDIESDVYIKEDVLKLLTILKQDMYGIGIVTSLVKRFTNKLIKNYLKINFDIVITYIDTRKHKPNPEPLLLARDEYIRSKRIQNLSEIYIGDSLNDIIAGKNAKMKTGLAAWYLRDKEISLIIEHTPDYVFYKPLEILQINI